MINTIIIIILVIVVVIGAAIYLMNASLEDIRESVYQLFVKAEHKYLDSGTGQQKMKYVIQQARGLLPKWAQLFITDAVLEKVIERWFQMIKDLLDDGKLNKSIGEE